MIEAAMLLFLCLFISGLVRIYLSSHLISLEETDVFMSLKICVYKTMKLN